MNKFDVTDRVVVITGGLGQLGYAFAKNLVNEGAKVSVVDLNCDKFDLVENVYGDLSNNPNLMFIKGDVTKRDSLETALESIQSAWGCPFGLVNNAAIDTPPDAPAEDTGPFETFPEKTFDNVMEVNVKGVVLACQVFGGAMAENNSGSIVNISSVYGNLSPDQRLYDFRRQLGEEFFKPVSYSVSKSALFNLTKYLAVYWAEAGVRTNTVTFSGVFNNQPTEFLKEYVKRVPLGRMANVEEYVGIIQFLMSDAASYMTGSNITLDGGFSAW